MGLARRWRNRPWHAACLKIRHRSAKQALMAMSQQLLYALLIYTGAMTAMIGLLLKWRSSLRRRATARKHAAQDQARRRGA
jgi:hypothetical protein